MPRQAFLKVLVLSSALSFFVAPAAYAADKGGTNEKKAASEAAKIAEKRCEEALRTIWEGESGGASYNANYKTTAEKKCREAQQKMIEGDFGGAASILKDMSASHPDTQCKVKGLLECNKIMKIQGLRDLGDFDEAWNSLGKDLADRPEQLKAFKGQFWLERRRWYRFLLEYALKPLFILVPVCFGGWHFFIRKWKVDVTDFESCLQQKENTHYSGAVKARFEQTLSSISNSQGLGMVEGPAEKVELPDLSAIPEANDLWKFFKSIIPDKTLTIKGSLNSDKKRGAGLYIKFIHGRRNKLFAMYEVWQDRFDPDFKKVEVPLKLDAFMMLVGPAAHDALWETTRFMDLTGWRASIKKAHCKLSREANKKEGLENEKKLRKLFGSDDRTSYVYRTMATEHYDSARDSFSERMLRRALAIDQNNYIAWMNLGLLEKNRVKEENASPDIKDKYKAALQCLDKAIEIARGKYENNLAYVSANYHRGDIKLHIYCRSKFPGDEDLIEAFESFKKACEIAEKTDTPIINQAVRDTLTVAFETARCIKENKEDPTVEERFRTKTDPRILYNLAWHNSLICEKVLRDEDKEKAALDNAIEYLQRVFAINQDYAKDTNEDWGLKRLREDVRTKERFEELINELVQKPRKDSTEEEHFPLAPLVGPEMASALHDKGINSIADLLEKASSPDDRRQLDIPFDDDLFLYWVRVAELGRISGVGISQIVLLSKAGVSSLKELKGYYGREHDLLSRLRDESSQCKTPFKVPEASTLDLWIKQAKKTKSIIR